MRVAALLALMLVAAALATGAQAKDRQLGGGCSESGDVCTQVFTEGGVLFLNMNLAAKYFSSYKLCVTGPKGKVCKTFQVRGPAKKGDTYHSKVAWRANFPYQGAGAYKVDWGAGKTVTFRLPLKP